MRPIVHHIPVCPFSQRLEILLALKERGDAVAFRVADITRPRDPALLALTGGSTALPVMQTDRGVLKESLVILRYLDETIDPPIARADAHQRAVEAMLIALEGPFTAAGYRLVMNQDATRRDALRADMLAQYALLDEALAAHSPDVVFLFERFGLAECVFTPLFARFWFLEYYEDFELPAGTLTRVRRWRDACLAHPAAQQVSRETVVKLYYDYAKGHGNGALPPGRRVSSLAFSPHWRTRPWPPRDKYGHSASDTELGLLPA
jgi:glutathione S-transferase